MKNRKDPMIEAAAGFLYGQNYFVNVDFIVPGTDTKVDLAGIFPKFKELRLRFNNGFAPIGVIQHLIGKNWVSFKEISDKSGFNLGFIDCVVEDGVKDEWFEFKLTSEGPFCRIKNYKIPAKELILIFNGTENFNKKIEILKELDGGFSSAYFIFPYEINADTIECIAKLGAGVYRYFRKHGVFQEVLPPEINDIKEEKVFALIAEKILYDNVWIMTEEPF